MERRSLEPIRERLGAHGASLFTGAIPQGASALTAREFLKPDILEGVLDRAISNFAAPDRRVAASLFVKRYAWMVTRTALAPMTMLGVALDVSIDNARVVFSGVTAGGLMLEDCDMVRILPERWPDGRPPGDTVDSTAELHALTRASLVDQHLAVVIETLHELTGCSRQIMWGSAGHAAAYLFDELANDERLADRIADDRATFLERADAPFHRTVQYLDLPLQSAEGPLLTRRTCCLWYRVRPDDLCYYCPLLKETERLATLRRLGLD